jgi:capsular polysaccharide export protein
MRRVLFVGAPFGRFFRYLAPALEKCGVTVLRTVCDGGEFIATPLRNQIIFRGADGDWESFLRKAMIENKISAVVTFNDSCRRTRAAHELADDLGIKRFVLEEGYLRPWWITFDHDGVNGNSLLPRDQHFYLRENLPVVPHETFKQSFRYLVRDTIIHFSACTFLSPILPYDASYYGDSVWQQAKGYARQYLWRKTHSEAGILRKLREYYANRTGAVFVALMQKPGDAQLRFHSEFRANNPYIRKVVASFAAHADKNAILVVKQHPLDYGIEGSRSLFDELVTKHGLEGRAFYVCKLTIESVLEVASGLVTINSTGGLAAIEELVPTIALGKATYDVPGMTFQDGIDRFWTERQVPDATIVAAFVNYLKSRTQVNGGYYSRQALTLLVTNLCAKMTSGMVAPHYTYAARPATRGKFIEAFEPTAALAPASVQVRS